MELEKNDEVIGYVEMEELLKCYPVLTARMKSLQVDLQSAYIKGTLESEDAVIYALSLGNRRLDGMPLPATGNPSDKTGLVAQAYKEAIANTKKTLLRDVSYEIVLIAMALEKIDIALSALDEVSQLLLKRAYWQGWPWDHIGEEIGKSKDQAQRDRQEAIRTMLKIICLGKEEYKKIMKILDTAA